MKLIRYTIAMMLATCLGLSVTIVSAQSYDLLDKPLEMNAGEMPLDTALFMLVNGVSNDFTVITRDVSDITILLPNYVPSVGEFIAAIVRVYNLCASVDASIIAVFPRDANESCNEGTVSVVDSGDSVDLFGVQLRDNVDSNESSLAQGENEDGSILPTESLESLLDELQHNPSETASTTQTDASKGTYRIRFTIAQINEQKAASLGINWNGEAFQTVAQLVLGSQYIFSGYFPQPDFDKLFSFLEREGVAIRDDSLELFAVDGEGVAYNRGGSLNVQLVSGGAENIQASFQYGLTVNVTVTRLENDTLLFNYDYADVDPGNTSDPTFINLANTSTSSSAIVKCGSTVIISSLFTRRDEGQGEGLPQLSRVPALGYLAGSGTDSQNRSSYIIAVTVNCPEVSS